MNSLLRYWPLVSLLLAVIVVIASMKASRQRYWVAFSSLACLNASGALAALVPMLFAIFMADAFGPGRTSAVAYLPLALIVIAFVYPMLSLLPNFSAAKGRKFVFFISGLVLAAALFGIARTLVSPHGYPYFGWNSGVIALLFLLLWLRVYDLRMAVEATAEKDVGPAASPAE